VTPDSNYPAGCTSDPNRPWARPNIDPRTLRAIDRRADELATIGFDTTDETARDWIRDNTDLGEVCDLLFASIRLARLPIDPDAAMAHYKAVDALRELFVKSSAHIYREQAEREIEEGE
jgi:hypothetical protein